MKGNAMFHLSEEKETYDGGAEVCATTYDEEFSTLAEAKAALDGIISNHVASGHTEIFANEKSANFVEFSDGKYAVASYTAIIGER